MVRILKGYEFSGHTKSQCPNVWDPFSTFIAKRAFGSVSHGLWDLYNPNNCGASRYVAGRATMTNMIFGGICHNHSGSDTFVAASHAWLI